MNRRIISYILVLFSVTRLFGQVEEGKRTLPIWFDHEYVGGTLVVKNGNHELRCGDMVQIGTVLTIQASVTQKNYSLAVLKVGENHYVSKPVLDIAIKYRVSGATIIKPVFTQISQTQKSRISIRKDEGGSLGVFVGDQELQTGASVPFGTVLRIKAISGKSFWLTGLSAGGNSLLGAAYTDNPIEVFYRIDADYTPINATFTSKATIPAEKPHRITIKQDGDGGWVALFVDDDQIFNGDLVPNGTTITIKALSDRTHQLSRLTAGRLGIVATPTPKLIIYPYIVRESTLVTATFSPKINALTIEGKSDRKFVATGLDRTRDGISILVESNSIDIGQAATDATVYLYNAADGRLVAQGSTNKMGSCRLTTEKLPASIYLLRIGNIVERIFIK